MLGYPKANLMSLNSYSSFTQMECFWYSTENSMFPKGFRYYTLSIHIGSLCLMFKNALLEATDNPIFPLPIKEYILTICAKMNNWAYDPIII